MPTLTDKTMKPALLILFVCLGFCKAEGQDFQGEANEIADTIFNRRDREFGISNTISAKYWTGIYDSVLNVLIRTHLKENVDKEKYSWPNWYFHQDFKEALRKHPNEDYQFLLRSKYHVNMEGVSAGCIWHHAFIIYDSLMMVAIMNKYGYDFFDRSEREADSITKFGLGLELPYIINKKKTKQILADSFRGDIKQAQELLTDKYPLFLVLKFHGDTITYASVNQRGDIQGWLSEYVPNNLLERIRKYKWAGPRFMNKPIDYEVYFDFNDLMIHRYPY